MCVGRGADAKSQQQNQQQGAANETGRKRKRHSRWDPKPSPESSSDYLDFDAPNEVPEFVKSGELVSLFLALQAFSLGMTLAGSSFSLSCHTVLQK